MLSAIAWYQRAFSWKLSPCRFYPSCSNYGYEAILVHGPRRGLWLTIKRLGRCRPFGPSGVDPVPDPSHQDPSDRDPSHRDPSDRAPVPERSQWAGHTHISVDTNNVDTCSKEHS